MSGGEKNLVHVIMVDYYNLSHKTIMTKCVTNNNNIIEKHSSMWEVFSLSWGIYSFNKELDQYNY